MSRQHPRKRLSLSVMILDSDGACDCCLANLPAGEVVIHFDGNPEPLGPARDFCVDCVQGISAEAAGIERAQKRARPIVIRVRELGTNAVVHEMTLRGGASTARRALRGLTRKVDLDRFWVDDSELEEREAQKKAVGK